MMSNSVLIGLGLILSATSYAAKPECVNVGTRSEGWAVEGQALRYANCAEQVVRCDAVGTRSEGWYAFNTKPAGLLGYDSCANEIQSPVCILVGTRSEGWSYNGRFLTYDNCQNTVARCGAVGTRSEGWYKFDLEPAGLITYATCGSETRR